MLITAILAGLAAAAAAQSTPATPPLDPSCFAAADWLTNPEDAPMQIFGCRESADIPAPNAQGWVTYEPSGGGFVWGKLISVSSDSVWTFRVMYNSGGAGNFEYEVTGEPDMNGIIPTPKVKALGGT